MSASGIGGQGLARHRVRWRITVAGRIGDPAKAPTIGHAYRKRPAGFRHAWREQRRRGEYLIERGQQRRLTVAVEVAGIVTKSSLLTEQIHRQVHREVQNPKFRSGRICAMLVTKRLP
jgi:hypothetical protein